MQRKSEVARAAEAAASDSGSIISMDATQCSKEGSVNELKVKSLARTKWIQSDSEGDDSSSPPTWMTPLLSATSQ